MFVYESWFCRELEISNNFQKGDGLDAGENGAIVMAEEKMADLLLMNERKGRIVAKMMGLSIMGTVSILLQAFDEELLSGTDMQECLEQMK